MTAVARKPKPKAVAGPAPNPDALDIVDEMVQNVTLNRFFDNNPETLSDEDLMDLISVNRRNRAIDVQKDDD